MGTEGTLRYIPSLAQVSYAEEVTYNDITPTQGAQTLNFGLTPEEINLPDSEIDWKGHRCAGNGADIAIMTEGPRTLTGSIPMMPQDGRIFKYLLGTSADAGSGPSSYTHAITGNEILPSICVEAVWDDGTNDFVRYFTGVKCSGGTIAVEEEGSLKFNMNVEAAYALASTQTKSTVTCSTTDPWMFYQGSCTFWGTTFARVTEWEIDVKRNLKPRRYIQDTNGEYPYEINEGARDITLTAKVVAADDLGVGTHGTEAFKELMAPTSGGFDINLVMTRGTDTLTFKNQTGKTKCRLKNAKHPRFSADAEDSSISIEVVIPSLQIDVVDSIATY